MELRKYKNILHTLDHLQDTELDLIKEIHILKNLLKNQNYDLKIVGSSGVVIFGSNKSFAQLLKPQYKKINKDKINTIFKNLEKNNLIWRLTRQVQEQVEINKNERKGFPTAVFILPTYKEFQAELYNLLKKAITFKDIDQIVARALYISNLGLEDDELKDKVLAARNYIDKKYKDNIISNLISVHNAITPGKVLRHRKDQKSQKTKQLEYKDKGKVKLYK